MDTTTQIVIKIIKAQQNIIGPIAYEEAGKVKGLRIISTEQIEITGELNDVISNLLSTYKNLFGTASVEVSKEAVKDLISQLPPEQVPSLLRN